MDPETERDTDIMILDYLCCRATNALLLTRIAELQDQPAHAEIDLVNIFGTWNLLISHKHGNTRQISEDLDVKLVLFSFTTRFFTRLRHWKWQDVNPRLDHSEKRGGGGDTDTDSDAPSEIAYTAMRDTLRIPREDRLRDTSQVESLLDMCPDFTYLCDRIVRLRVIDQEEESVSELLGRFLIQATIEQHTLFGKDATDAISEAKSSIPRVEKAASSSSSVTRTEWVEALQRSLDLLQPPPPPARPRDSKQEKEAQEMHLNSLARQFPLFKFEVMMVMKLQEFLFALETPILVQLETGELNVFENPE